MGGADDPEQVIADFWRHRSSLNDASAARFHVQHTEYDRALLTRLCRPGARVLDLGCGTLSIGNWLVESLSATVHGVDSQASFLLNAINDARMTTEQADVRSYTPRGRFDLILLLGVIQHIVSAAVRDDLYRRLAGHLAPDGALVVKSQFGVRGEVEINAFSEALGANYYSLYPDAHKEASRLGGIFSVEVFDIYPDHLSPHHNTRFFHLVCRAKSQP